MIKKNFKHTEEHMISYQSHKNEKRYKSEQSSEYVSLIEPSSSFSSAPHEIQSQAASCPSDFSKVLP
jgi:hypothetical protein